MSLLVIQLPPRARVGQGDDAVAHDSLHAASDWSFVFSRDGRAIDQEATAPLSQLPKTERVVLVVPDEDVAWLSVRLPKTPASRVKELLAGALEDQLLEDPAQTHLALGRDALQEGQASWVAALHKPWLEKVLATLRAAGVQADALVCACEPQTSITAHARLTAQGLACAVVSGPHGVVLGPLDWPGWRARFTEGLNWTAEPTAAQALSDLGQVPDRLLSPGERILGAASQGTNLLQFDLAPQMKGSRALLAAWATFKEPRFRAVHIGLVALALVQVIGLNARAWQAQREIQALQGRAEAVLREGFPTIQVVVDPLVQAERELQTLRRTSGLPGPSDLETWLDLLGAAWAGQAEPLTRIQLDPQGLRLEAAQWPSESLMMLQDYARQQGWQLKQNGSVVQLLKPGQPTR